MRFIALLLVSLSFPVYAGGNHSPPPQNVPDGGSNHNALAIAVVIGLGICIYHQCLKAKPEKVTGSSVPETPENEYITIRQKSR